MAEPGSPAAAARRRNLFSGLDLGKSADYSVLATVERFPLAEPVAKRRWRYELVWLAAWDLGTRYTAAAPGEPSVIGDLKGLFDRPALTGTTLAVDYTGVGLPVYEQIAASNVRANRRPILITGGHKVTTPEENRDGTFHVPKVEIVGIMVVLLEAGLLKWVAAGSKGALKHVDRLERELGKFREFVTRKKNVTFEAESGAHDDFVLALGLALWLAENLYGGDPTGISVGEPSQDAAAGSVLETMPAGASPGGRLLRLS